MSDMDASLQSYPYAELSKPAPPKKHKRTGASWTSSYKFVKVLKAFKTVKVLKPLASFGSMGFSMFAYSFTMGYAFAIGFVLLLFCHEAGHAVALKRKGIKASLPVFIPFLGAAIFAPKLDDRDTEAHMAFAGPFIGSACALLLFLVAITVPGTHPLLLGVAFTALLINLFNLIPISPLDGGRVTQAIGPWFKYVGIAVLVVVTLVLRSPGLLVIWVLVLSDLRIRNRLRLQLGLLIEAVAAFMMVAGIGTEQNFWLNVIDLGLMTLMNGLFWLMLHSGGNNELEKPDQRPQLPKPTKLRWTGLYLALAVTLIVLMLICKATMPAYMTA